VTRALPRSATNASSLVSVCCGLAAPGSSTTRQALSVAQPRLGDASPVTLTPSSPKRGASWSRMIVIVGLLRWTGSRDDEL
jgi:hypothetical protein